MKHFKRFGFGLLALLLVLGTMSGCRVITDTETTTTTTATDQEDDATPILSFEKNALQGEEMVIRANVQLINANSFDAKQDGDVINDAVYNRNKQLTAWFGCAIRVEEFTGNTSDDGMYYELLEIKDTPTYHLVSNADYKMVRYAAEGFFHDLAGQPYIDLNQDYYDDSYNDAYNVGGRQYLVTGKFSLSWYRYQIVTFFNRNMFDEKGIAYPYQTVLDHKWTVAEMGKTANKFYEDLNGDGLEDEYDQFGYVLFVSSGSSQTDGFMSAFNLRLVEKDADGYLKAMDIDQKTWGAPIEKFRDMLYEEGVYSSDLFETASGNTATVEKFTKKNAEAAMITYRMCILEEDEMTSLSQNNQGYGILPLPMADENQDDYISYMHYMGLAFGIPKAMVGDDLKNATMFLEAFAYVSYHTTVPAYYEKALGDNLKDDQAARSMLQIIDSNVVVDPVNVYYNRYFNLTTGTLRPVYSAYPTEEITDVLAEAYKDGAFEANVQALNEKFKALDQALAEAGYPNAGKT